MDASEDVLAIADRLWRGEVSTSEIHPLRPSPGLAEVADGVAFVPSFANVSAVSTDDGLMLVDTGSALMATDVHHILRRWSPGRLNTAVYSHGHIDHVFGVPVWAAESAEAGWPEPVVVAHEALPARFDRYILTAGYNGIINRRQFNIESLQWPTEYRYPDRTYRDRLDLTVGGTSAELHHAKGETDDHTWTWFPHARVLCCGDLFIWASPNAGNPQKVQRYPLEWADALRRMLALFDLPGGGPEVLLPGHGYPVIGGDRVRQALGDTAELLESLVEQTLALMNGGARLDEVIHTVKPPHRLMERPYLRPVYDEPEFIVRTVWRLYGGWWDGNPATLKPAPERTLALELADLAGGAGALADRALALIDPAGDRAGESGPGPSGTEDDAMRLAGHLAELAWLAAPDDPGIREARRMVFSRRADAASSTMAHGVFSWAARESGDGGPGGPS
ncbi:MAG TPA: alkyl sulfatase dimerization domain-containing protein [Acidimicrobiales bacterium]|nr:alkyl sulfatase dimerization domain-containing protein [Acidimicrobiales bacterium]